MMQGGSLWAVDRRLRERYRSFIRAEFWFRDPALRRLFAEELENIELMREPYLEFAPPYRLGRPSRVVFRDLLDREVLREFIQAVRGDRPLYSHQEEALRRVWRGRNVVVATGTGSGKTEAFLLPILLSLYEEWSRGTLGPGVRALVLYPMNALAFDQRARLAEIARALKEVNSSFRFTFGQYTGQTPEDERDGIRRVGDEEERRAPHTIREGGRVVHGELLYRNEMRATPPHILITNYSMLEYLLIRPSDSPFFDGESARSWRFFVVDEVHTYSGVRGQELALLLRRLKERLRAAGNCQTFRCIATSATLFAAEDAEARIADFAARLFGEPFDSEDVIVGQRTDLDEHLPDGGDEDLREALVRLQSVLQEGPKQVSEVASSVFPGEDIEQARVCLFELLHHIERSGSGRALSALRLHVFVRGLEGAYVRYTPELEVTFADQSDAEGKCFELALCRTCGQHYLVGQIEKERFGAANRDYSSPDYRVDYLLPLDEDAGNLTANYWLCPKCSTLGTSASCHRGCGVPLIPILFQEEAHDRESGELKYCLVCNEWTADPVRELVYGGEWPQAVIATTILEVLPPERQKLLAFADNRQDAAYFAVRLDEWALELALRRALVEAIENLSDHTGTQVLSLRDVHNALRSSVPKLMDLGVASTDAE
ncbi:MAG: DEAD/DEAH box helicase [Thermomicrobium sp.]|nr:DEAD/DEAH box helicase [Thermomicrobium sp.]